jgi:hypothetical protein
MEIKYNSIQHFLILNKKSMEKIKLQFLMFFTFVLFLSSCKNNTQPLLSFAKSELGLLYSKNIIMQDNQNLEEYLAKLGKAYNSYREGNLFNVTLVKDQLTLEINYDLSLATTRITSVDYKFKYKNIDDKDVLKNEIVSILLKDYKPNGVNKKDSNFKYELSVNDNSITISFFYDSSKESILYDNLDKYLSKSQCASDFILTHFEGQQIIPENEIWVVKELHECEINTDVKTTRNDLISGKVYGCKEGRTSENRSIFYEVIINSECYKLKGNLFSDGPLKKYSSWDIQVSYDDPSIYGKYSIDDKIILFPGMSICVCAPLATGNRLKIEVYKIKNSNPIGKYVNFKNKFYFDKSSPNYIGFMGFETWKY